MPNPTFTNEQSITMADIENNPRLLFTREYTPWRLYLASKSPEYVDRLFESLPFETQRNIYRDWVERMEGRKVSDEEFNELRKQYPANQIVIEDEDLTWDRSYVPRVGNTNEVHIGKRGTHEPEIENTIITHEKDHAYGIPKLSEKEVKDIFGYNWDSYLREDNGAEMFARLGQIANWYGIKNIAKQPLTGDMIKYAAQKGNFIKDANFDNMTNFFSVLKANNSWDSAAKAFNKYGKALVAPMLLYSTFNYKSNETDKNN